jgi:hypothetical protein
MRHWFWLSITIACIVWYSTVTIYVAFKGIADIKQMLARLSDERASWERETRGQGDKGTRGEGEGETRG